MLTFRHRPLLVTISAAAVVGVLGPLPGGALNPVLTGQKRVSAETASLGTAVTKKTTTAVAATGTASRTTQLRTAVRNNLHPSPTPSPTDASIAPAPVDPVQSGPTAAPTAAPVNDDPSGVSVPRGDLTGWHQVYAEDFGASSPVGTFPNAAYSSHWDVYDDGWKDTSKNGTYMPSKVLSAHDGLLDYYVHTEGSTHMVAAPWLKDTKGKTYGRYSVRFKSDALPGYKTAWLLWPDSEQWPSGGEIDFPEGNLSSGSTIHAFAHYASSAGGQDAFPTSATYAGWHTVTVEWVPGKVTFILDGTVIGSSTKMVPSAAMHWVLQTETNLDGYAPSSSVAGHVYVDWVAFWTRSV